MPADYFVDTVIDLSCRAVQLCAESFSTEFFDEFVGVLRFGAEIDDFCIDADLVKQVNAFERGFSAGFIDIVCQENSTRVF